MKKILIMIIVLLLCGCGANTIAWEDVSSRYEQLSKEAEQLVEAYDSYDASEYRSVLGKIENALNELSSGVKKDSEAAAETLIYQSEVLRQMVLQSDGKTGPEIEALCDSLTNLVKAAYEKSSSFKEIKESCIQTISEILSMDDDAFASLQKKRKIRWSEVSGHYEALEEEIIQNLPKSSEISEILLEGYKNDIISNYEPIMNGVSEDLIENADAVYEAAVALRQITSDLDGETAEKVYLFADQACSFVREAYGEKTGDPEYDFLGKAQEARKWTLSVWNELVKLINL